MSFARGVGVTGRLGGAEVVARRYNHGVDAVVDAFVMCGCTIFVDVRDINCFLEFLCKSLTVKMFVDAVKVVNRTFNPHFHATVRGVVRQNRHYNLNVLAFTKEVVLQGVTECFKARVDEVGAHRVAGVKRDA